MSGLHSADSPSPDALGVSEAMGLAKTALESFTVKIVGEVSEVSVKPGYKAAYFTIKDSKSALPCMMWNNRYAASGVRLQVGMLVEVVGRFTLYVAKGRMNFDVSHIQAAGQGDLRIRVANLARKLEAEGLMARERKRPIPKYPERIGVVTSPRGAAVHDVMRTLRRRFPIADVLVAGVPVEGARAASCIIQGIGAVASAGVEVVLVVRGGGSYEDLMPFNDEQLARAIASCPVPIVTGIGHEPDNSIADMVSDFRASTPTAAAETVSPSGEYLKNAFDIRSKALSDRVSSRIEFAAAHLARVETRPVFLDSMQLFAGDALSIDHFENRLRIGLGKVASRSEREVEVAENAIFRQGGNLLDRREREVALAAARLNDLSPLSVIARGYSITRNAAGSIVRSIAQVEPGERLEVSVSDGIVECETVGIAGSDARKAAVG